MLVTLGNDRIGYSSSPFVQPGLFDNGFGLQIIANQLVVAQIGLGRMLEAFASLSLSPPNNPEIPVENTSRLQGCKDATRKSPAASCDADRIGNRPARFFLATVSDSHGQNRVRPMRVTTCRISFLLFFSPLVLSPGVQSSQLICPHSRRAVPCCHPFSPVLPSWRFRPSRMRHRSPSRSSPRTENRRPERRSGCTPTPAVGSSPRSRRRSRRMSPGNSPCRSRPVRGG